MDLEQRLHESLVAPDPGTEFTVAVMARVGHHATGRRPFSRSGGWGRRRNRFIVIGIVAAVAVAAAMLVLQRYGVRQQPVVAIVVAPSPLPEQRVTPAADKEVADPAAETKDTASAAESSLQPAAVLAPAASQGGGSARYTVVAMLRHQSMDVEARAAAEKFYGLLLAELRKVPGLTLRLRDAANPVSPAEGEYGLWISSLETGVTSTGFISYMTTDGQGAFNPATNGNPWPLELRVVSGAVERGGLVSQRVLLGTAVMLSREGVPRPAMCSEENMSARMMEQCQTAAQLAVVLGERLRTQVFPLDSGMHQQLLARINDAGVEPARRVEALGTLLRAVNRDKADRSMDAAIAAAAVRLAADQPAARQTFVRTVRGYPHPSLVVPLLDALNRNVDNYTRREALTTLVADYAGDPRARAGLQVVANDEPDRFLRALAGYVVTGVESWHDYVRETLKDASLPPEEKVKPLVYSSDEASGAFQMVVLQAVANDPQIVDAVLAIARANRDETDVTRKGPIRRALYALQRSDGGPVVPGSRRQEVQELYQEFSPGLRTPSPPAGSGLPSVVPGALSKRFIESFLPSAKEAIGEPPK